MDLRTAAVNAYRRSGADVPFGDPLPSHGTEMEGWFWRVTDAASGRVVVALCSVNRNADGDWATVAVALHPGGLVRSAALDGAEADQTRFTVQAGTDPKGNLAVSADRLCVDLDDVHLELQFDDPFGWPKAFGGGAVLVDPIPQPVLASLPARRKSKRHRGIRRQGMDSR